MGGERGLVRVAWEDGWSESNQTGAFYAGGRDLSVTIRWPVWLMAIARDGDARNGVAMCAIHA